ncbi:unnamed protein product [Vitrella brassicaformis CCMP3155]|uniref:Protein kinase domain-containing protein n=1 Tax=Vitrella brassicaformis (strain CCMP3155) TaxID=1169540 RepID=A0A0G4G5M1_VITBC|nr:unnamed protein product [Vitrella brassicaformis CCMP3155]|eukprot:CEM23358.1 unnamed protein product [Vitrella brassicaformis CCMP3155]
MAHPPQVPGFINRNFDEIRYLGEGGFGVAWQAHAREPGDAVELDEDIDIHIDDEHRGPEAELVVKMNKLGQGLLDALQREHTFMDSEMFPDIKDCPNVMSSLAFKSYPEEGRGYLIMEYGGPTLSRKLWDHAQDGLPREEVKEISQQLVNAHRAQGRTTGPGR